METVSVDRVFDASIERVRAVLAEPTDFFDAAGFGVDRDGDRLELTKQVAVLKVELTVRLRDDESATLAYEQISGPFAAMETRYEVTPAASGSTLTIQTAFDSPQTGFGTFINGAAVERQRRGELDTVGSLLEPAGELSTQSGDDRALGTGE